MASRSFRVFGTRTDLESVFYEFQKLNLVKYYKCGRNENKIDDITKTIYFGISLNGSHIGNQYLVIKDDKSICFDKYKHISQYLNETSVSTTINGYMILKNAYSKKEQLRFVTIGAQSPREYDLIV